MDKLVKHYLQSFRQLLPEKKRIGKEALLPVARSWMTQCQDAIKSAFLKDNDAQAVLKAQSALMDALITVLFESAPRSNASMVAVLAVGGYGRRELFPYSDIDLLFLYQPEQEALAASVAEFILYVLWDLGLKVGQAHRTVEDCITQAQDDMTIRTTLLDARPIVGHQKLFADVMDQFSEYFITGQVLDFVEAKLAERDARHLRFGDSRYVLEPNVKEGKGGLRDLHTLWWLARYVYSVEQIHDLVDMALLTPEEYHAFEQARSFLWRVRCHLHYIAGRAEDRLTFDRQHALALAMGFRHPSVNRSIERFMRRYFVAVRTVGNITRIICALLEDEKKRKPRKSLAWIWLEPWVLGGFKLEGERLDVRSEEAFEQNPVMMLELFRMAQVHGLDIHPRALQLIARHLRLIDAELRRDPHANAVFMDILLAPEGPEITLRRMNEAGVLGRFIPDFGRVTGQTQFNMYHVYTVDEHTLVALGILFAMEKGRLRDELPLASRIIHRIKMRRVLYLALFCHDIAKGRGGDHSELGEQIALRLARRFGFSEDETDTTGWLVRQHLLFSNTAFKRDIDDPKAVKDFVEMVQTPERLKLLLVLTAADIRAVGPSVWNAWKGSLLRELYARAEQCMGTGTVEIKKHQADQFRRDLRRLLPGWKDAEVDAYIEQGNPAFWANFDLPRHAAIARMVRQAEGAELPLLMDIRHDHELSITEIIICTRDQNQLFSKIAGAMSISGANITNAKVFTLKNGIALDIFQVHDSAGEAFDRPDRLAKLSVHIEQALSGDIDLYEELKRRASDYSNPSRNALPVPAQVFIENDASNICSVIELTGRDRSGILYGVTKTMAELGLSIATAHITTYGTQIADVFYVKDMFGLKITHDAKIKQVREALLAALNG